MNYDKAVMVGLTILCLTTSAWLGVDLWLKLNAKPRPPAQLNIGSVFGLTPVSKPR